MKCQAIVHNPEPTWNESSMRRIFWQHTKQVKHEKNLLTAHETSQTWDESFEMTVAFCASSSLSVGSTSHLPVELLNCPVELLNMWFCGLFHFIQGLLLFVRNYVYCMCFGRFCIRGFVWCVFDSQHVFCTSCVCYLGAYHLFVYLHTCVFVCLIVRYWCCVVCLFICSLFHFWFICLFACFCCVCFCCSCARVCDVSLVVNRNHQQSKQK